jgi:RNA polymerase sigma factor (sigma-70 family)
MLDIVSVGNHKLNYQDHNNVEFEPLSFYITLAQKTISKFGKNFSANISKEMLKSEDAIANVANCIMMADWRWDKDRKGETGQQKTKYSYRNQCAIWAIKSYVSRKKNKKSKSGIETCGSFEGGTEYCLLDILCLEKQNPVEASIAKEESEKLKKYLSIILSPENKILTERQCEYLKLYYIENKTFADIGKQFNITREAVRQGIKKSIEKIRELDNINV